jgi:hypothetical protein
MERQLKTTTQFPTMARIKVDKDESSFAAETLPKTAVADEEPTTVVSAVRLFAMGGLLLAVGTTGFFYLPGMMKEDAKGSRVVNAFYCTVMSLTT